MDYPAEIEGWKRRVNAWLGVDAVLVHVSSLSSDIRIYRSGDLVFKVRRLTPASMAGRPNSLEDEHTLLRWLASRGLGSPVVPMPVAYRCEDGWEMLEMRRISPPVITDPVAAPRPETIRGLCAMIRAVWRLNRAGVSHGDLQPDNVGCDELGRMVVLDFDQAAFGHWTRCFLRDFFGVPFLGRAAKFTVLDRAGLLSLVAPICRRIEAARVRARGRRTPGGGPYGAAMRAEIRADPALTELAGAWQDAAQSGANSPGSGIAYYSLDLAGIHFPGERPWPLRWHAISRTVDFCGKRVVELGCNMALLSIHARLSGATAAVAADINARVLAAAARAAAAFGVEIAFHTVNFDADQDWERRLGEGDVATALSLTYWLQDKERIWRYLACFPEVIFEGHEPAAETEARFRNAGFGQVAVIALSERKRPVYYARRT